MIRPAALAEIDELRRIEAAAMAQFAAIGRDALSAGPGTSAEEFVGFVRARRCWVATADAAPIGFILVSIVDGAAHLEQIAVRPDQARRGIGRRLIDAVEDWARRVKLPALVLTTFADVPWNAPYYARLGFRSLARDELGPGEARIADRNAETILGRWPRVTMRRRVRTDHDRPVDPETDSTPLIDHWAREPTWPLDRRLWALYLSVGANPPLVDYVRAFQDRLSDLPGLDLVESRWLHLTVLGVAFVDEVESPAMDRLVADVAEIAASEAPIAARAEAPRARVDAVWMPVATTRSLIPLRDRLRLAVIDRLGREPHALPLPPGGFRPHITIAYARAGAPPAAEVDARLSPVDVAPVRFEVGQLSLLRLERRSPRWSWDDERQFALGGSASD